MSEADTFLPLLFQVQHASFNSGAENDLGNKAESWSESVEKDVYGWGPPSIPITPTDIVLGNQRVEADVQLMVPPGWQSKHRDRFQLGTDTEWYRQVGPTQSYEANPLGWNPGGVVNLIMVTGTGGET